MREGTANAPAVRIARLAKHYGRVRALTGLDLEVRAGETLGLVGVNGAGKTTLIKCMLDLCDYESGAIEIFGVAAREPHARSRLAYFPERFLPPHYLRGDEFLKSTLELAGERYDAERAARLLDALELEREALGRSVRTLSKGMAQKLGLAGCFLVERSLYVLDEPMSGLDPAARVAVKSVLARLGAEARTLFFTSHVLADVEELCSSIAVLDRGAIRFRGTPAQLCARYSTRTLEGAFMRCVRDQSSEQRA
jgi:ABC-2 type transport system ATP-binding protein